MERVKFKNDPDEETEQFMVDQKQCRLCLQYFKEDEEVMKIPICEHILHSNCLKKWLIDF